jgi:hypothetical protein
MAVPYPNATNPIYVVVVKGDTLSQIAKDYLGDASKYEQLASINNIPDANYIIVGQKIYLSEHPDADKPPTTSMPYPNITRVGFQADSDSTVLVTWDWNRHDETSQYCVRWYYGTNDGVLYSGGRIYRTARYYTFNPYENASNVKRVVVKVSALAKSGVT